jgi:hypothetical protein
LTDFLSSDAQYTLHNEEPRSRQSVHAVAEAFQLACQKGDNVTVDDLDEVFMSQGAFAFAEVRNSLAPLNAGLRLHGIFFLLTH